MGEHQRLSARFGERKNLFLMPEFEPWTLQPVASGYIDYAVPSTDMRRKTTFRSRTDRIYDGGPI